MPEEKVGALNLEKIREIIALLSDPKIQQLITFIMSLFAAQKMAGAPLAACPPDCPECPDGFDADEIRAMVNEACAA